MIESYTAFAATSILVYKTQANVLDDIAPLKRPSDFSRWMRHVRTKRQIFKYLADKALN